MNLNDFIKVFLYCSLILLLDSVALGQILGGGNTTIDNVPFMVQIHNHIQFLCAGSLITDYLVVTAAHCVLNSPAAIFVFAPGAANTTDEGAKAEVIGGFRHKEFNITSRHMDVAVIKLEKPFKNIPKPIDCKANMKVGTPVLFLGRDHILQRNDTIKERVRTSEAVIMDHAECVQKTNRPLTNSTFCTQGGNKYIYPGGPVLCDGCFCGIVSSGNNLAGNIHVRIHTNLQDAKPFINNVKKSNA